MREATISLPGSPISFADSPERAYPTPTRGIDCVILRFATALSWLTSSGQFKWLADWGWRRSRTYLRKAYLREVRNQVRYELDFLTSCSGNLKLRYWLSGCINLSGRSRSP
jgi:hypothetical protein